MCDAIVGLEVDLYFTCMHSYDCITRRSVFRNTSNVNTTSTKPVPVPVPMPVIGKPPAPGHRYPHPAYMNQNLVIEVANSMTLDLAVNETNNNGYHVVEMTGRYCGVYFECFRMLLWCSDLMHCTDTMC